MPQGFHDFNENHRAFMAFIKAKGLLWPFCESPFYKSHRAFMSSIKATGLLQSLWIFADIEK